MKKILVTGAYGFVGTNISQCLSEKGHLLTALDQSRKEADTSYQTFFSWDNFEEISFDEYDVIIHLAGKAHDTKNRSDAQSYFNINTALAQRVFDAFLKSKSEQFIFFSSIKAAADKIEGQFITEDVIPKPVGPYGESKIKAEEYILSRIKSEDLQSNGVTNKKIYIFRPCMIHGPGNKGNLNLLYNVVSKGIPYPLGAFDNKRSFLNIWNLSYILDNFITRSPESGIYHLADDNPVSTNKLIRLIAESKGKKVKIWRIRPNLINWVAKLGDICKLPLNSDRLQKLTENYVVSNQKVKSALGISELPVNVITGLKRTLGTFQ